MSKLLRSVGRSVKLSGLFLFGTVDLLLRRPATRIQRAEWLHSFCARLLCSMKIATRMEGAFPPNGVIVSNHVSYLDIIAFAAQHRCVFLSKAELAQTPLIGWMATMAGTVYVDRGSGGSAERARTGLVEAANDGIPVVIFPEGTTSDGTSMLPFRSGALAQVRDAGLVVTAALVSYRFTEDNGPAVSIAHDVAYWGDEVRLLPHVLSLLALRGIEITIKIAPQPIEFESSIEDRKQAAVEARAAVMELARLHDQVPAR